MEQKDALPLAEKAARRAAKAAAALHADILEMNECLRELKRIEKDAKRIVSVCRKAVARQIMIDMLVEAQ